MIKNAPPVVSHTVTAVVWALCTGVKVTVHSGLNHPFMVSE